MEEEINEKPITKKSKRKTNKKMQDDLLVEDNNNNVPIIETKNEVEEENCYYKNKLWIYKFYQVK